MNTQSKLTELDATKLANLRLRQQLLTNEVQAFEAELKATYMNPGEDMSLNLDNTITRTPRPASNGKGKK